MTDLYLKFASEDEAQSVLYTAVAPLTDEDGNTTTEGYMKPHYANIDTIGVIYEPVPVDAPEDYFPVPKDGWHVNVRLMDGEDAAALEPYLIYPKQPIRIWG